MILGENARSHRAENPYKKSSMRFLVLGISAVEESKWAFAPHYDKSCHTASWHIKI